MASGTLGQVDIPAFTNTVIYTVPAGKVATINICLCNKSTISINIRLGICASTTPTNAEYINYELEIPPYSTYERTGIAVSENKKIVLYSNFAGISANVYGFED